MASDDFLYLHHAHLKDRLVGVGDKIRRGTLIGHVGNTGNAESPHDHCEVKRDLNEGPNFYPTNILRYPKWKVAQMYINPAEYFAMPGVILPFNYTSVGYGFLQLAGNVYHPGLDLNLPGWADYGLEVFSSDDATVVFSAFSSGWGNHIWLKVRNPWKASVPLLDQVNAAIREAVGPQYLTPEVSRFFQDWVMAGKPSNYRELIDDIKGFFKNKQYPFAVRLIDRVNEAIREATGSNKVEAKVSSFFQKWVADGKPGSYQELVDDIRGFQKRREYPFS